MGRDCRPVKAAARRQRAGRPAGALSGPAACGSIGSTPTPCRGWACPFRTDALPGVRVVVLLHPIWLFLLIPLVLSLWRWPLPSRLLLGLRGAAVALALLALCGLALRLPSRDGTVVVVADRSLSMPPGSEASQKEAIELIQGAMGRDDRLAVVAFGQSAQVERAPDVGTFPGF